MKTIMIVDDQPHVRQLVEISLRREGWRVVAVESGEAAIVQASAQPPDLIIMDIMMPGGMDGFQAIEALKRHPATAACPVLVLTAKSQESERRRSLELGAAGYLAKPFKLATLIAQVEELLHGTTTFIMTTTPLKSDQIPEVLMKKDILGKGAIIQRDKETYAIAPHIPAGITSPAQLRKIADVAEKYGAQALKLTSAQRIAIVGLDESKLDEIWSELDEKPGAAIGMCVRSVKVCPGTTFCKRGQQDSVAVGLAMDEKYHGLELTWKFKMGVSGCPNDCGEVCIKDLGLIASPRGWNIMVGGNGGSKPRLSVRLIEDVPTNEEALAMVDKVLQWFKEKNQRSRLGKYIEDVGFEAFQEEVLAAIKA